MKPLLVRVSEGDRSAIEACLDEYGDLVWRLASRYLDRAQAEIEDAVQEVFVELWLAAGRFEPDKGGEAAFVATIAHRRLIDYQRRVSARRRALRRMERTDSSEDRAAYERAVTADEAGRVGVILRGLPEEEKNAMWLWLYRGLSHREISAATGAPLGTVKSRLRRALTRFDDDMQQEPRSVKGGVA